jgi:hypothetical protein
VIKLPDALIAKLTENGTFTHEDILNNAALIQAVLNLTATGDVVTSESITSSAITQPARIGGVNFRPGVKVETVLQAAYRNFDRESTPEKQAAARARTLEFSKVINALVVRDPESIQEHTISIPADLHPLTQQLIVGFATALAQKAHAAEMKYGFTDNWVRVGWMDECRDCLSHHVTKGDPRDVALYAAFLWHHNEPTHKTTGDERA